MKVKYCFILILALSQAVPVLGQKNDRSSKRITLNGTVTDMNNNPVEGALIFVDTVYAKSTTNELGNYRIKADPSARNILAVLPDKGFGQVEIKNNTEINIKIGQSAVNMPVFVTTLLKSKKIVASKNVKMNTYPNIYEMIRQEVPGVIVSGTSIVVRQPHSFFGSTTPLFVVNGVKVPSIDYISPTQVKKIELLTGSQTALYSGIEATPGVIKITLFSGGDK
jgi:hypothetical protein